jgi:hypothetical protein
MLLLLPDRCRYVKSLMEETGLEVRWEPHMFSQHMPAEIYTSVSKCVLQLAAAPYLAYT